VQFDRLNRRAFIALLGGAAVARPRAAAGQPAERMSRVGVLWPGASPPAPPRMESFRQALRQLGFVEGRNLAIELRDARGGLQQLPDLAAELVRLKVDVITTFGDLTPKIAQQATQTIPIVAIGDDILGAGIITSLSRPGGNTTGLTILAPELSAKRLEVLQALVPGMSRVAALWDPTTGTSQVATTENAARSLKLKLQILEVHRSDDLAGAFQAARNAQAQAVNVFSSPFLASLYREIIGFAAEFRLPAIYQWREQVEAGGLVSYGPGLAAMWRQSGVIVAKILKGAKPADLPVEQPTKFELVVNAKTAQSLGLAIAPSVLVRADELIE
jgi:putative tryptophan/tyrosine transport system substrate-binding protein